jgi:tRNA A-37 threonylcarbamoyl transferase component Bud32
LRSLTGDNRSIRKRSGNQFSGFDDSSNILEGLHHAGISSLLRRSSTEFGSGWDPLRKFAANVFKGSNQAFGSLVKSSEFQGALKSARVVKSLGSGGFAGEVSLMEANLKIGGQETKFQFVKKTLKEDMTIAGEKIGLKKQREMLGQEARSMREVQDLSAPSLYKSDPKNKSLYMKYFEPAAPKAKFGEEQIKHLEEFLETARQRGVIHQDLLQRQHGTHGKFLPHNIVLTSGGNVGVLDYGLTSKQYFKYDYATEAFHRAMKQVPEGAGKSELIAAKHYNRQVMDAVRRQLGPELSVSQVGKASTLMADTALKSKTANVSEAFNAMMMQSPERGRSLVEQASQTTSATRLTGARKRLNSMAAAQKEAQTRLTISGKTGGKGHQKFTSSRSSVSKADRYSPTNDALSNSDSDPFAMTLLIK